MHDPRFFLLLLPLTLLNACETKGGAIIDEDMDGFSESEDCDDGDSSIYPGATELCNNLDDDCDGLIDDEDDTLEGPLWSSDQDGDTFGDPATSVVACMQPADTVPDASDCDDTNPNIHPDAEEIWYDGIDQNCDTESDYDQDMDGFDDLAWGGQDCDDLDALIHPEAKETWYDGIDQNCDGLSDYDSDLDGYDSVGHGGEDCNDVNAEVFPGASEVWYDGLDQDCDGLSDYDADLDGYDSSSHGGEDCDDANAEVRPSATEIWYDGIDQDCDGHSDYDADLDSYDSTTFGGADCDDANAAIHPTALESWYDGIDQNCDGRSDYDADLDSYDSSAWGGADCDDADDSVFPGASDTWYDGVDQDCDGHSDYDADLDGYDSESWGGADCDDTSSAISPAAAEVPYDGVDQNCDDLSDYDADLDGYDSESWGGTDCDDTLASVSPSSPEVWYDGIDQNCDDHSDYDQDSDGYDSSAWGGTDCDDTHASAAPGGTEVWYDGIDGDCSGGSDYDQDGDGANASAWGGEDCDDLDPEMNDLDEDHDGWTTCEGDCDDADIDISPGELDLPDGVDNDCNGLIDDLPDGIEITTVADFSGGYVDGNGDITSLSDGEVGLALRPSAFSTGASQASLTTAVSNPSVVATGGYIYVMGGSSGSSSSGTPSSGVYSGAIAADGSIASWTSLGSLPRSLSSAGAATDGHCIVLAGGYASTSTSSYVYTAVVNGDGTLGSWTTQASLDSGTAYIGATVLNGYVYLIGGSTTYSTLDSVYYGRLDPDCSIDSWTATTDLPGARYYHSVTSAGNQIYVVGGRSSYTTYSTVYRAAPSESGAISAWVTEDSLPTELYGLSVVVGNGYLYATGGNDGSDTVDDIYYSSISSDGSLSAWGTSSSVLSGNRVFHRVVTWDNALYQIAGRSDDLGYYDSTTRTSTVYRLPLRTTTSTAYTSNTTWYYVLDLGADVEILTMDWSYTPSTSPVSISYRLAPSATGNAGSWTSLGSSGSEWIIETGRYLQIMARISSTSSAAASLQDLTISYR